ncbi:protein of unknown function [Kyrpidia spormannii]|uniref:Uncharacterized protein n=1 Tax=Kyrpidia spormannii TaxID=2055160 RepID=A0ACA8Z9E0_9BACL|nr:protein of unknown function [Kyrpidia spormannii]
MKFGGRIAEPGGGSTVGDQFSPFHYGFGELDVDPDLTDNAVRLGD